MPLRVGQSARGSAASDADDHAIAYAPLTYPNITGESDAHTYANTARRRAVCAPDYAHTDPNWRVIFAHLCDIIEGKVSAFPFEFEQEPTCTLNICR